uniref:COMM domain-containing protein 3 n=1 Tax=Strigamia maritima TaxID=126957 RepID=T1J4Q3_STRMM
MELSKRVIGGLQLVGDSSRISEPCFLQLTDSVFFNLLKINDQKDITVLSKTHSTDVAVLKQSYAALLTVTLEAAKLDLDPTTLNSILDDKLSTERCATFISRFKRYKSKIRVQLSSISHTLPHIVDAAWRLEYCIKSNIVERIDESSCLISLKTEKYGQEETEDVTFSCNPEQLQDLVSKLKDAVKCMERMNRMFNYCLTCLKAPSYVDNG